MTKPPNPPYTIGSVPSDPDQQDSPLSQLNSKLHLGFFAACALLALAFAWGLYESVTMFLTGVLPRF